MAKLGIIAGSGATFFPQLAGARVHSAASKWGHVDGGIAVWEEAGHQVLFLSRHGSAGNIPPHKVNYRANIWALNEFGAESVVALNAVGGISRAMSPGTLVFPDQLIDYSWGREHTFHSGDAPGIDLEFVDFTIPYSEVLRNNLIRAARDAGVPAQIKGTYGVTQGPRLETAAEIDRLERDGCDIVGMTGMPEAALARERGMHYASCSFVVNWAAGRSVEAIHDAMGTHLQSGMLQSAAVLRALLKQL